MAENTGDTGSEFKLSRDGSCGLTYQMKWNNIVDN